MYKKDIPPIRIPSAKKSDQPATSKMLSHVRDELKSDIRSLDLKMDSRFAKVDGEFALLRSDIEKMRAENFRMNALFEEQNSNNRIVLEGLQALWQRQERIEQRA